MAASPVKNFLVTYLMPEKCYERLVVNWRVHVPCLKFVMNRVFGFWIILDTFLAQLPQLLKILWTGSAAGLSLSSALLQLYALTCPVVYAVANNFPLFAWAERLFTLTQTAAIVFLILHHRGQTLKGMLLLPVYGALTFLLGSFAAAAVVSAMQNSSLAALVASKALQVRTNHCNGHTGQLSSVSVLLSGAGSLGVTCVSLQEAESLLTVLSHSLSAALSCVLLAQLLCCRSTDTKKKSD